jgi:hypothetical protein
MKNPADTQKRRDGRAGADEGWRKNHKKNLMYRKKTGG